MKFKLFIPLLLVTSCYELKGGGAISSESEEVEQVLHVRGDEDDPETVFTYGEERLLKRLGINQKDCRVKAFKPTQKHLFSHNPWTIFESLCFIVPDKYINAQQYFLVTEHLGYEGHKFRALVGFERVVWLSELQLSKYDLGTFKLIANKISGSYPSWRFPKDIYECKSGHLDLLKIGIDYGNCGYKTLS